MPVHPIPLVAAPRGKVLAMLALLVCVDCGRGAADGAGNATDSPGSGGSSTPSPAADAARGVGGAAGSADAAPAQGNDGATTITDAELDARPESSSPRDAASVVDARGPADASSSADANTVVDAAGAPDGRRSTEAGTISGDGSVDPCGPNNPARVPLPTFGASAFDVRTFGAVGDDRTDNTTALQAALDAATAAGGGVVSVPAGTYLSGPIVVGSGTRLDVAAGAVLKMLPMSRWPGATPFITANDAHDIALTGSGTIEGQGQDWWNALTATPALDRPQEVVFNNSTRVLIGGIRLQNPPVEHIWVKDDTDVTITGITIATLAVAGQHGPSNTDGVDVRADGLSFAAIRSRAAMTTSRWEEPIFMLPIRPSGSVTAARSGASPKRASTV